MWILAVSTKLILYIILLFFNMRLRTAIDSLDYVNIKNSVMYFKLTVYLLFIISLIMFLSKFFIKSREHKLEHHHYCGINYVNMALISVLLVHTQQVDKLIQNSNSQPIAIESIDARFRTCESFANILVLVNFASIFTAYASKYLRNE